jgi:uncharacterized protein (TIGR03066 family)
MWWLAGAVALYIGASATYYLVDFVIWPRVPSALVGQWRVVGGEQDGVVLRFLANGEFQARISKGEDRAIVEATAQVDGQKIRITSTNPITRERETKTHLIHQLTDVELTLEDPSGRVSRLIRIESPG